MRNRQGIIRSALIRFALIRVALICSALILACALGLAVLAGCGKRPPGGDEAAESGCWLAGVRNPFYGKWLYERADGVRLADFWKDGTLDITDESGAETFVRGGVYMVRDRMLLVMRQDAPECYAFEVRDNDTLTVFAAGGSVTLARHGEALSSDAADYQIPPRDGFAGTYWRTAPWTDGGGDPNAYDWLAFAADGTFRRRHYRDGRDYGDGDEFSYILRKRTLLTLSSAGDIGVYGVEGGIAALGPLALDRPFVPERAETTALIKFEPDDGDDDWPVP